MVVVACAPGLVGVGGCRNRGRKSLEAHSTRLVGIHWRFIAHCYRRGCSAATTDCMRNSVMAAGFVLSYPRARSVPVSRVDVHGVTKKVSGPYERPAE